MKQKNFAYKLAEYAYQQDQEERETVIESFKNNLIISSKYRLIIWNALIKKLNDIPKYVNLYNRR